MIFGKHTLKESKELLALVNFRFMRTSDAYDMLMIKIDGLRTRKTPLNEEAITSLTKDWNTVKNKWDGSGSVLSDKPRIENEFTSIQLKTAIQGGGIATFASSDLIETQAQWEQLLAYIEGGEWVAGSFQDVQRRIETFSGKPIDRTGEPKVTAPDVDFTIYKAAAKTTDTLEKGAAEASKKAGEFAISTPGLIIGGGILVGVIGVLAVKKYL